MNKRKKITSIIVLSIAIVCLLGCLLFLKMKGIGGNQSNELPEDVIIDVENGIVPEPGPYDETNENENGSETNNSSVSENEIEENNDNETDTEEDTNGKEAYSPSTPGSGDNELPLDTLD